MNSAQASAASDVMPIGERIRVYRRRRGMSQPALAQAVGRSESWLSQVERGVRSVDKFSTIIELARVLRVEPADLTGQPLSLAPNGGIQIGGLDDVRSALVRYDVIPALLSARSGNVTETVALDDLQRRVDDANRLYQAGLYSTTGRMLGGLVADAEAAEWEASSDERREAAGVLCGAYQIAAKP